MPVPLPADVHDARALRLATTIEVSGWVVAVLYVLSAVRAGVMSWTVVEPGASVTRDVVLALLAAGVFWLLAQAAAVSLRLQVRLADQARAVEARLAVIEARLPGDERRDGPAD